MPEQAIKTQRSPFLERWSKAEAINGQLLITVLILTICCGALAMALVYTSFKPKPIYYIPSIQEAGIAYPHGLPDGAVSVFAVSWVLNWTNFTPVTVDEVYKRAQRFMLPKLLARTKSRLESDIAKVKGQNASSLFSIQGDPILTKENNNYQVMVKGEKKVFMDKDKVEEQNITFRINLKKVNPTDLNPYGLMVEDIDQDVDRSQL